MERQEAIDILAEGRGDAISVPTMQSVFPWHEAGQGDVLNVDASQCMGSASTLGLGLALARPDRKVMVLDGDGSLLMQLGDAGQGASFPVPTPRLVGRVPAQDAAARLQEMTAISKAGGRMWRLR